MFGSESQGLSDPIHVLERISDNLTKHARNVLAKQVQEYPSMKVAADKLSKNNVICSSSVAFSLQQRFDEQQYVGCQFATRMAQFESKIP